MQERTVVWLAGGFVIAAGLGLGGMVFLNKVPPGQDLEAAVGAGAFGAVLAAPGVLALLSLRNRPALLLPAAILLFPLSFLSLAGVTLPLLVPAVLLLRAFVRSRPTGSGWRTGLATCVVVVFVVAALVALFAHADPRTYTTNGAVYGTSDVITYWEAALSLTFTSLAVYLGWRIAPTRSPAQSEPRDRSPAGRLPRTRP